VNLEAPNMASPTTLPDVLTIAEAAAFLRLPEAEIQLYAGRLVIPGRQSGDQWRFSRRALEEWLRGSSPKEALLSQAGAFEDDKEDLESLRASIYSERGRPEVENVPEDASH
jgi:excisionase family DNA binding protein